MFQIEPESLQYPVSLELRTGFNEYLNTWVPTHPPDLARPGEGRTVHGFAADRSRLTLTGGH